MPAMEAVSRLNSQLFRQLPAGSPASLSGRCVGSGKDWILSTADGGTVPVSAADGLELGAAAGFVELLGTKGPEGQLCATVLHTFPAGEVDAELWEEAVKLAHNPQLRDLLFKPADTV
eukprot:gb/GFBE01072539.1/.p1 GENE.gb/GFBE01072539.1/~~gb/GFBE01072539.1/.p1  ORF type:complete len:118 (+),score=28.90 gb/GFBE01072539.1/:1-354(+)